MHDNTPLPIAPHSAFRVPSFTSRRRFLASSGFGIGAFALAGLLRDDGLL
ncbi:MAG: hypothetical protein H7062_25560, partial [Candidatus Saccharimonas sp.]|nr:hypothetical protein [Planctomycetaceae bacterium]